MQRSACKGLSTSSSLFAFGLRKLVSAFRADNLRMICGVHLRILSGSICSGCSSNHRKTRHPSRACFIRRGDIRRKVHHGGVCIAIGSGYQSDGVGAQRNAKPTAVIATRRGDAIPLQVCYKTCIVPALTPHPRRNKYFRRAHRCRQQQRQSVKLRDERLRDELRLWRRCEGRHLSVRNHLDRQP